MLRYLGCSAALLAFAGAAFGGERYVEVWNPPEARIAPRTVNRPLHAKKVRQSNVAMANVSRNRSAAAALKDTTATPKETVAGSKDTATRRPVSQARTEHPALQPNDIPRAITPEGNILRVSYPPADGAHE